MTPIHQLLAIVVMIIWGTNFVFIRIGLDDIPSFTFASLRFIFAAFPLILFLPKPQVPWRYLAAFGIFIGFGLFGLMFWAMQDNISPGLASLVVQMQVFFTILLSTWLFAERIHTIQVIALFISFSGVALIASHTDGTTTIIGLLAILAAALSWSCGNVTIKKVGKVEMVAFLAWSSIFAVPPLLLMAWWLEGPTLIISSLKQASLNTWLVVAWQTVGNTLIGYGLWNSLLHRYPAAVIAPWALLIPVSGMAASSLVLGEPLPWWKVVAAALILCGLVINMLANRKQLSLATTR
ncbi:MAG: EamA family transporter [Proteobacteria bacterium]|nr:MAG: EamA family transporter [Pseudomonadota bacterium]